MKIVPAVSLPNVELPNGVKGQSYSQKIKALNGVAPYSYKIIWGALPASLNGSNDASDNSFLISGEVTADDGNYPFEVEVTDAIGMKAKQTY